MLMVMKIVRVGARLGFLNKNVKNSLLQRNFTSPQSFSADGDDNDWILVTFGGDCGGG